MLTFDSFPPRWDHWLHSFRARAGAVFPTCSTGSRCDPVFAVASQFDARSPRSAHMEVDPDSLMGNCADPRTGTSKSLSLKDLIALCVGSRGPFDNNNSSV